ncbi:MAG: DNA-protecting protein DprA, partial [Calditrichaeota bacterium]
MEDWTTSADEMELLLNLTQVSGIGAVRIRGLLAKFGKPSAVVSASMSELVATERIDAGLAQNIKRAAELDFGRTQLKKVFDSDYRVISFWSQEYPGLLKQIDDPPILLFVWGQLLPTDAYALALVGTRVPTQYGRQVTEKITSGLVDAGATIVSGLARGIDTIAHAETVKRGGRTLAVLGSGLDLIYPAENRSLAQAIVENGAVVTEFAFGTKPDAVNFPRRNRIISGLSLGTIVIEAREKSGALITANIALEQNREVFAVPGSIFSPPSQGCHALIKEGAKLVAR